MNIQTIFQFKKMLLNLDQCMVKAAAFADHKKFDTTVLAQEVAIPNFYFRLMAAYSIMRHAGVDIGKMDYLGKVDMKS